MDGMSHGWLSVSTDPKLILDRPVRTAPLSETVRIEITGLKTETRSIVCGKSNVVLASGSMRMEHRLNMFLYGTSAVQTGANGQNGDHAVHHVTEEKLRERESVFMMGNVQ